MPINYHFIAAFCKCIWPKIYHHSSSSASQTSSRFISFGVEFFSYFRQTTILCTCINYSIQYRYFARPILSLRLCFFLLFSRIWLFGWLLCKSQFSSSLFLLIFLLFFLVWLNEFVVDVVDLSALLCAVLRFNWTYLHTNKMAIG